MSQCLQDGKVVTFCPCAFPCIDRDLAPKQGVTMLKTAFILSVLAALSVLAIPVQAADCEKALFGWTANNGTHIRGVLANEGVSPKNPRGYQNNPHDRGNFIHGKNCGGTAYGLACANYPRLDVKAVTRTRAVQIYHDDQWAFLHGDEIRSQYLAYKVFDLMINMGAQTAVKLLQMTVNDLNGHDRDFQVTGRVTPELVRWVNVFTAPEYLPDGQVSHWRRYCFFEHLKGLALMRYGTLIAKNRNLAEFWDTWRYRAEYDR